MADKYTLRRFLMFRALIARRPDPTKHVNAVLAAHPDWNQEEIKSWAGWKDANLPDEGQRSVESAETTGEVL